MNNIIYLEYYFKAVPFQPTSDILIAELGEAGFESFVEEKDSILAYIQKSAWTVEILDTIEILENPNLNIK